jgi:hypothetical protein
LRDRDRLPDLLAPGLRLVFCGTAASEHLRDREPAVFCMTVARGLGLRRSRHRRIHRAHAMHGKVPQRVGQQRIEGDGGGALVVIGRLPLSPRHQPAPGRAAARMADGIIGGSKAEGHGQTAFMGSQGQRTAPLAISPRR